MWSDGHGGGPGMGQGRGDYGAEDRRRPYGGAPERPYDYPGPEGGLGYVPRPGRPRMGPPRERMDIASMTLERAKAFPPDDLLRFRDKQWEVLRVLLLRRLALLSRDPERLRPTQTNLRAAMSVFGLPVVVFDLLSKPLRPSAGPHAAALAHSHDGFHGGSEEGGGASGSGLADPSTAGAPLSGNPMLDNLIATPANINATAANPPPGEDTDLSSLNLSAAASSVIAATASSGSGSDAASSASADDSASSGSSSSSVVSAAEQTLLNVSLTDTLVALLHASTRLEGGVSEHSVWTFDSEALPEDALGWWPNGAASEFKKLVSEAVSKGILPPPSVSVAGGPTRGTFNTTNSSINSASSSNKPKEETAATVGEAHKGDDNDKAQGGKQEDESEVPSKLSPASREGRSESNASAGSGSAVSESGSAGSGSSSADGDVEGENSSGRSSASSASSASSSSSSSASSSASTSSASSTVSTIDVTPRLHPTDYLRLATTSLAVLTADMLAKKRYKVKLCPSWERNKSCPKSTEECHFAHGAADLRVAADSKDARYRTKICRAWLSTCGSYCGHEKNCAFSHGVENLKIRVPESPSEVEHALASVLSALQSQAQVEKAEKLASAAAQQTLVKDKDKDKQQPTDEASAGTVAGAGAGASAEQPHSPALLTSSSTTSPAVLDLPDKTIALHSSGAAATASVAPSSTAGSVAPSMVSGPGGVPLRRFKPLLCRAWLQGAANAAIAAGVQLALLEGAGGSAGSTSSGSTSNTSGSGIGAFHFVPARHGILACSKGDACPHAHGLGELRLPSVQDQTKLVETLTMEGSHARPGVVPPEEAPADGGISLRDQTLILIATGMLATNVTRPLLQRTLAVASSMGGEAMASIPPCTGVLDDFRDYPLALSKALSLGLANPMSHVILPVAAQIMDGFTPQAFLSELKRERREAAAMAEQHHLYHQQHGHEGGPGGPHSKPSLLRLGLAKMISMVGIEASDCALVSATVAMQAATFVSPLKLPVLGSSSSSSGGEAVSLPPEQRLQTAINSADSRLKMLLKKRTDVLIGPASELPPGIPHPALIGGGATGLGGPHSSSGGPGQFHHHGHHSHHGHGHGHGGHPQHGGAGGGYMGAPAGSSGGYMGGGGVRPRGPRGPGRGGFAGGPGPSGGYDDHRHHSHPGSGVGGGRQHYAQGPPGDDYAGGPGGPAPRYGSNDGYGAPSSGPSSSYGGPSSYSSGGRYPSHHHQQQQQQYHHETGPYGEMPPPPAHHQHPPHHHQQSQHGARHSSPYHHHPQQQQMQQQQQQHGGGYDGPSSSPSSGGMMMVPRDDGSGGFSGGFAGPRGGLGLGGGGGGGGGYRGGPSGPGGRSGGGGAPYHQQPYQSSPYGQQPPQMQHQQQQGGPAPTVITTPYGSSNSGSNSSSPAGGVTRDRSYYGGSGGADDQQGQQFGSSASSSSSPAVSAPSPSSNANTAGGGGGQMNGMGQGSVSQQQGGGPSPSPSSAFASGPYGRGGPGASGVGVGGVSSFGIGIGAGRTGPLPGMSGDPNNAGGNNSNSSSGPASSEYGSGSPFGSAGGQGGNLGGGGGGSGPASGNYGGPAPFTSAGMRGSYQHRMPAGHHTSPIPTAAVSAPVSSRFGAGSVIPASNASGSILVTPLGGGPPVPLAMVAGASRGTSTGSLGGGAGGGPAPPGYVMMPQQQGGQQPQIIMTSAAARSAGSTSSGFSAASGGGGGGGFAALPPRHAFSSMPQQHQQQGSPQQQQQQQQWRGGYGDGGEAM